MYKRAQYQIITERLKESRHFLQVVLGPRQVGKTTLIKSIRQTAFPPHRHLGFQIVGIQQEYRCGLKIYLSSF